MGLMHDPGQLIVRPHPVLMDGYRELPVDLLPGESLYAFVSRYVPDIDTEEYEVAIGGIVVPREQWTHVRPKHGQLIEVRSAVGKSVVALVAMAALMYFTMGAGAAAGGAFGSAVGAGTFYGMSAGLGASLAAAGTFAAGSMLINKFLAPKPPSAEGLGKAGDPTYSLNSLRNTFRAYEPAGLLFGRVMIVPDLSTDQPYTFSRNDDQYLAVLLNCGINVDRVDDLYQGDALLSSFDGVETYYAGFTGMAEDDIPLYSNTDTIAGGSLDDPVGTYVQRTSAADAIRLEVDLEYTIYDFTSKGKAKYNTETVTVEYRPVGSGTWQTMGGNPSLSGGRPEVHRRTFVSVVPEGQYDVRAKRNGTDSDGDNAQCSVTWAALRSVQADTTNYDGMARIGVTIKASGQLNGSLDQVRCVAYSRDLEYWNGSAWVTDGTHISNPGAQILQYARGWYDSTGKLIAGMGLSDSQIDLDAIKAFILHCQANGYTYDYHLKERRNHRAVRDAIAAAGFGSTTWSGGKLSVVWAADDQPLEAVVNMATIKKAQFQVDYTFAGMADGIVATYLDASDWKNKEVRINAPGVETALNPASIALEGVTDEATAAKMARYHLGQSLYQWKSIGYATDLEHVGYRRMSLLALQHDLTAWGHGGRVMAAVNNAGTVTLTLDEPVPPPESGGAYIGLCIPGEGPYRVFGASVASEGTTVVLTDPWPTGVPFPGDSAENPAHDTRWVYDFSAEPGRRVRVVEVQPESDLKGARVIVAPESDEFWNYVETGEYIPPSSVSGGTQRPVASNVRASYMSIVQGNTTFGQISVLFDVAGPMLHAAVYARYTDASGDTDGQYHRVADTLGRSATFRSSGAGDYDIIVRPYAMNGVAGGEASTTLEVTDPDIPPIELFTVDQLEGGVRRYGWGYTAGTITPPDLMGVEVRYVTGHVALDNPPWSGMTPLGDIHHGAFESVDPAAGDWTFGVRAVTTGDLVSSIAFFEVTLAENLGEVIDGIVADHQLTADELQDAIDAVVEDVTENAQAIIDEATARADADIAAIATAAADATTKVNNSAAVLQAQIDVVQGQVADIYGADVHDPDAAYPEGDLVQDGGTPLAKLYRAKQDVPADSDIPLTDTAYWELLGNYASLGEAVAANLALSTTTASELEAVSQTVTDHSARMPAGTGQLATDAQITTVTSAIASGDAALAQDIASLQSQLGAKPENLMDNAVWADHIGVLGATITGDPGGNWALNGAAADYNEIAVAGSADNPAGPFGAANLLWRAADGGDHAANAGGFIRQLTAGSIDPDSGYIQTVYFYFTPGDTDGTAQNDGTIYHGTQGNRVRRIGGFVDSNPYFVFERVENLQPDRWYLAYGVLHPQDYTGGESGLTGIYDIASGQKVNVAQARDFILEATAGDGAFSVRELMYYDYVGEQTAWFALPYMVPLANAPSPQQMCRAFPSVDVVGALAANAAAIDGITTRVEETEDGLEAVAQDLTDLGVTVGDKADASAVNALEARVEETENGLSSVASDTTALGTRVGTAEAALANTIITQSQNDSAHSAAINLLNAGLEDVETGLVAQGTITDGLNTRVTATEDAITSQGSAITALENTIEDPETGLVAVADAVSAMDTRVTATEAGLVAASSAIDSVEAALGDMASASALAALDTRVTATENTNTSQASAITAINAELANKASASALATLTTRVTNTENVNTSQASAITSINAAITDPDTGLESTASAVEAMDVRVSSTEAGLIVAQASYGLSLNVGGKVVGIYALNDGTTGTLIFDFDEVIFENASGSSRIEGGMWVRKTGGYMVVEGIGFGANSDLMKWYGTERDPSTCTKANAIGYEDTSGHIYYPSATFGDIQFDAGSDSLTAPQTLQLVNNDTNGNAKVVTARWSFVGSQMVRFNSAAPSGSATLSLWRKVGAGSFVQLGVTQSITMDASVSDYGDDWWYKTVSGYVEYIVNDTDGSLSDHTYEWRLTSRTVSSGIAAELQSMSLSTLE